MAFPTRWLQLWLTYPHVGSTYRMHSTLFWFSIAGTITPPIVDFDNDLGFQLSGWINNLIIPLVSPAPFEIGAANWFYRDVATNNNGFVNYVFTQGLSPIPASNCVVIHRETGGISRSSRGMAWMSGLDASQINGNLLTPLALTSFQNVANAMRNNFFVRGGTFTPCMASYKNSTLLPILNAFPSQRLGLLHRRVHERLVAAPTYGPKPPPP